MSELKCSEFIIDKIDMSDVIEEKKKTNDFLFPMELRRVKNKLPEEKYNKTKFLRFLHKTELKNKENNIQELIKLWNSEIFKKNTFIYKLNTKQNKKPTPYQLIENSNKENKELIKKKLIKNSTRNNINLRLDNKICLYRNNEENNINQNLTELPHIKHNFCQYNIFNYYKTLCINNYTRRKNNKFCNSEKNIVSLDKSKISIKNCLKTIRNDNPKKKIFFNTIIN